MRMKGEPDGTMSPARQKISRTVPSQGASHSKTDLSLSSSAAFSPFFTEVPAATLMSITVSSLTVAPIEGIGTSIKNVSI
jgi:hypothetical protein